MVSGRVLGVIGCLLCAAAPCWAQSAALTEPIAAGDCFQVQIDMKLTGEHEDERSVSSGGRASESSRAAYVASAPKTNAMLSDSLMLMLSRECSRRTRSSSWTLILV